MKSAILSRNLTQLLDRLTVWRHHHPHLSHADIQELEQALTGLGLKLYGAKGVNALSEIAGSPDTDTDTEWKFIARQFKALCLRVKKQQRQDETITTLPTLNPQHHMRM